MSLKVYLYFNGNCRDAVDFYSEASKSLNKKL